MSLALVSRRAALLAPWNRNELWRRARAVPSLDLQFAENKSLVDAVTGQSLVTFTRASSGTYFDSAGVLQTASTDVPRFDHNPTTGESLGVLVEEARTNLSPYSRFASGQWSFTAASVGSSTKTAIDGATVTAFLANNVNTAHRVTRSVTKSYTANDIYTFSFYVAKPANSDIRGIVARVRSVAGGQAVTITVSNQGEDSTYTFASSNPFGANPPAAITSANFKAEQVTNKWVRISITSAIASVNSSFTQWDIGFSTAVGGENGAGTVNSELFIDAVQLESGSFATSYIPTTTAAATRSADVATDTTRGAALRSLYAQFRSPASGTRPIGSLDDNTANNRIELLTSGTDPKLLVTSGGIAQADINGGTVTANTTARIGARFSTDNFAASISGGAAVVDTSGTMPTVDRIRIGSNQAGQYLNGPIARITGWDVPLPNLPSMTQQ